MKWKPKLRQLGIEIQRLYKVFEGEGIATNRAIQKMYLEELTKNTLSQVKTLDCSHD